MACFSFISNEGASEYGISAHGTDGLSIESYMPVRGSELDKLISELGRVENNSYKGKVRINVGVKNINIIFNGLKKNKGVKVRSYITGWFLYSAGSFGSYSSPSDLKLLITNLRDCIEK